MDRDTMDAMDVMDINGHVQQVTSLNLSIRPSNGKSIVSIPSMMSILVHVHEFSSWAIIHCLMWPFLQGSELG
jgi:hypothetical protein